jgi:hypothetical protein
LLVTTEKVSPVGIVRITAEPVDTDHGDAGPADREHQVGVRALPRHERRLAHLITRARWWTL